MHISILCLVTHSHANVPRARISHDLASSQFTAVCISAARIAQTAAWAALPGAAAHPQPPCVPAPPRMQSTRARQCSRAALSRESADAASKMAQCSAVIARDRRARADRVVLRAPKDRHDDLGADVRRREVNVTSRFASSRYCCAQRSTTHLWCKHGTA